MSTCRIVFDADRCAGIGLCEATMPDVFGVGDDGKMRLRQTEIGASRGDELEEAAANCPTQSLTIQVVD